MPTKGIRHDAGYTRLGPMPEMRDILPAPLLRAMRQALGWKARQALRRELNSLGYKQLRGETLTPTEKAREQELLRLLNLDN